MNFTPVNEVLDAYLDNIDKVGHKARAKDLRRYYEQVRQNILNEKYHRAVDRSWEILTVLRHDTGCMKETYTTEKEFYDEFYEVDMDDFRDSMDYLDTLKDNNDIHGEDARERREALSSYTSGAMSGKYRIITLKERIFNARKG